MKVVITNAGFQSFYCQIKIHVYLQKNNRLTSLKWQPNVTVTYNNDMIVIYSQSRNRLEIVQGRPFLFRITVNDNVVVFYRTLSPQKCTKLDIEKQHAQGHLGSNLTPGRENRDFRKTVITNSTKPLCGPRGNLSWKSHEGLCHCKIHQKSYKKKNEGWSQIWPRVAVWELKIKYRVILNQFQYFIYRPRGYSLRQTNGTK